MKSLETIADHFFHALYRKEWTGAGEDPIRNLSIAEAYAVQDLVAQKRMTQGERIAGYKVGCTSKAIRIQLGFSDPIHARLFQPYIFEDHATLDWSDYLQCAIEPEMVLKIGRDLKGKNLSDETLIDSIAAVGAGIEIHDFTFRQPPPTIQELICSGGIHAGLIVGSNTVRPIDLVFSDEMFSVYKDDVRIALAPASEIMGGPLHSLRWLVTSLTEKGSLLKKNSLVIPGSPVELVSVDQDSEVKIEIENVGGATAYFKSR